MPLTPADQRRRIVLLTAEPAGKTFVTVQEANAGIRAECKVLADAKLGSTGTSTLPDKSVCDPVNGETLGTPTFSGNQLTPFWFLDEAGLPIAAEEDVWEALNAPGTVLWAIDSQGPEYTEEFASKQRYDLYKIETSYPTKPDSNEGYIKRVVPLMVRGAWENLAFA